MTLDLSNTYGPASHVSALHRCVQGQPGSLSEAMAEKRDGCIAPVALMTPRRQAEAAWHPASPYSVDELEALICQERGLTNGNTASPGRAASR